MRPTFDDKDAEILALREILLNAIPGPRVGDYVRFSDGVVHRVSHDWGDSVQTTDGKFGASFYLGEGHVSFSGGLYPSIPIHLLTKSDETREGSVWFFHHHDVCAGNGVHKNIQFRIYDTALTGSDPEHPMTTISK